MKLTRLNQLIEDGKVKKGRWELGPGGEIRYRLDEEGVEKTIRCALVAAEAGTLVASITERESGTRVVTRIVKLTGAWSLDGKNRITFEVEREKGKSDVLTFSGGWRVNDSNEVVYSYSETSLKTKTKHARELVFKGHWDISEKDRLTYSIGGDSNSAFRFRGAFQTKSLLAKEGEIRYQAGVEAARRRKLRTIVLFGKWKLSRTLGLDFEIEYADGGKRAVSFGGEYSLDDDRRIAVSLRSRQGMPLGVELILTRDFFGKDGQAFVRLQRTVEESRAEAGVKLAW